MGGYRAVSYIPIMKAETVNLLFHVTPASLTVLFRQRIHICSSKTFLKGNSLLKIIISQQRDYQKMSAGAVYSFQYTALKYTGKR